MRFPEDDIRPDHEAEAARPSECAPHIHRPGADSPRVVIRGESPSEPPHARPESQPGKITFIDYLSFTYRSDGAITDTFPLRDVLVNLFGIPQCGWKHTRSGWNGYENRVELSFYGLVAYGGQSQRNTIHVQLSGQGCRQVPDWYVVYAWALSNGCRITRIDLAHDDFEGATVNIANAIKWRDQGLFNTSGRPPAFSLYDDFDSGDGKTFYAGRRANGKLIRIYEKGKQQKQPDSPWCRLELELRAKDRVIGWDVVMNPDAYFGGACPALGQLTTEQSRIATISREQSRSLEAAIEWGRAACGPLINLLCILCDEDPAAVVQMLRRPGMPRKLEPYYKDQLHARGITP